MPIDRPERDVAAVVAQALQIESDYLPYLIEVEAVYDGGHDASVLVTYPPALPTGRTRKFRLRIEEID